MRKYPLGGCVCTIALTGLVGATATAGPALAADAPNGFASEATGYQNAVIADALSNNPTGVRTGPSTVEWKSGAVIMTVPATATAAVDAPLSPTASASRTRSVFGVTRHAQRRRGDRARIAATGTYGCPANGPLQGGNDWTCVYNQLRGAGTRLQFQDAGYYQDLHAYGGNNWITESYSNTRGQRSWLNQYADHDNSGASYCMSGHTASGNMTASPAIFDRWIYLSTNSAAC
jgi:hypothetical protein